MGTSIQEFSRTRSLVIRMALSTISTSESTDLTNVLYAALNSDRERLQREFFSPGLTAEVCNYYPRFPVTGRTETGSGHVSYLSGPYFSYNVPSCYGYSKFINVRKM